MNSFINFWQTLPSKVSPEIFRIGSFQVRYYGLMYIAGFLLTYLLILRRIKVEDRFKNFTKENIENFLFWVIASILLGGRIGYVIFYNFSYFVANPLEIFLPFDIKNNFAFTGIRGMSYHGAVIGALVGSSFFCKKYKINFLELADLIFPAVPLGYTFGRIGNFMNGELYGRTTDAKIGMYFPMAGDNQLRHPSQLYEGFFEGIILFLILWLLRKKNFTKGSFLGLYLIGYGFFRFFIEFVRQPDAQIGDGGFLFKIAGIGFSMGQILCFAMIITGLSWNIFLKKKLNQKRNN